MDKEQGLHERIQQRLAELRQIQAALEQQLTACRTTIAEMEALLHEPDKDKEEGQ